MNTDIDTSTAEPSLHQSEWESLGDATGGKGLVAPTSPRVIDSASSLSERLAQEIDDRKEERFYWIFGIVMLADVILLPGLGASGVFICALQVIFLIGLANKLGVDAVVKPLQNLLNRMKVD